MVRPELICLPSTTFIYSFKKTEWKEKISTAPSNAFFSRNVPLMSNSTSLSSNPVAGGAGCCFLMLCAKHNQQTQGPRGSNLPHLLALTWIPQLLQP